MTDPQTFRKRPVVIEAMQMPSAYPAGEDPSSDGYARNISAAQIYNWIERNTLGTFESLDRIEGCKPWPPSGVSIDPRDGRLIIATLEGAHWVDLGDWVIRGVQGEFYPCRDDIFRQTYEPVED